jgi:hypothetical protein
LDRAGFLREEYASVEAALRETLRHDYGPERSKKFYEECRLRLAAVRHAMDEEHELDGAGVADHLRTLAHVGSRVALLERSRLGEFSWPFADVVRGFAERLFVNEEATGPSTPIVHVVAEGIGYQIFDDDPDRMFRDRIMIVAFPRQLRHHVLLHAIFGHELGHPATKSDATGPIIFDRALPILERGPLECGAKFKDWLRTADAPPDVRTVLDRPAAFSDDKLLSWRFEILCDLFGLLLFGPAFACAHRTLLEPLAAPIAEYDLASTTHPPYPFRRRIIADAMRLLGWMEGVLGDAGEPGRPDPAERAERTMLDYAGGDPPADWTQLVVDEDMSELLEALGSMFEPHEGTAFAKPEPKVLTELLDRLTLCRPPIDQRLDADGRPTTERVPIQHSLYAGWSYWFGADGLRARALESRPDLPVLSFIEVNRLCEQALLQQTAIEAFRRGHL